MVHPCEMRLVLFLASLPEDELQQRQFPLGPGYLAAHLRERVPEIEIVITADADEALRARPDVVGISAVSQCFPAAVDFARRVERELSVPVILGGYHISALPATLPREAVVGVLGEGERTLSRLVSLLRDRGALLPSDLVRVAGICFREGDVVVTTSPVEPILPLDSLPYPERNIGRGARSVHLSTSRGCVYKCAFCSASRFWGKYRAHSAERVVDEVRYLIERYDARSIHLLDDLFFARPRRVAEVAARLEREGLSGRVPFDGFIASSVASRRVLEDAKRIGFRSLKLGAETGSDRLLKQMKGNHASLEAHQRTIDLCSELGIEVRASFMVGAPGERIEDLEATRSFLKRNSERLSIHGLYLTTPVPGTPYWELALREGLVSDDMDFSRLSLDTLKTESFDPDRAVYLNGENMPMDELMQWVELLRNEFDVVG